MRWPRYGQMKASGVAWLGEVPGHWDVMKIKRRTRVKRGASPRPIDDPIYFDDAGEYSWVRISDVTASEKYLEESEQTLSPLGASLSVKLEPGAMFLSIAATVGKPIITKLKCCIHDGFVYFPDLTDSADFLYYVFASGEPYQGLGKMGTQLNLNTDTVADIEVAWPPPKEQRAIAAFLDRETARIDALVAAKRRLIALLQEKRAALIARAVTRGLDPEVPTRDSGVARLGRVPAHWDVRRVKRCFEFLNNRRIPLSSEERGGMERNYDYYGAWGVIDKVESYLFDEPTLLVAEDGANLLSRSTPLAFVARGRYWVNNHAHILRPPTPSIEYWEGVLPTFDFTPLVSGSAQPKLTKEALGEMLVPVPPPAEQASIAEVLERWSKQIDRSIDAVNDGVNRLTEYRSTLITSAVTGRIDVRSSTP